jgi:hypothetical protein
VDFSALAARWLIVPGTACIRAGNRQQPESALHKCLYIQGKEMAGAAGLEPVTSAVTGQRSNQLSYAPAREEQNVRVCVEDVND